MDILFLYLLCYQDMVTLTYHIPEISFTFCQYNSSDKMYFYSKGDVQKNKATENITMNFTCDLILTDSSEDIASILLYSSVQKSLSKTLQVLYEFNIQHYTYVGKRSLESFLASQQN